jgi:hypothetical protein
VHVTQRAVAPEPKEIWEVPSSKHIGGTQAPPLEYQRRVTTFFDRVLLPPRSSGGVGLAAAVLIDATIIRALLLPASMKLLRRLDLVPAEVARMASAARAGEGARGAGGAYGLDACGGGSQRCGSPSQHPSLNLHRGHCQVPWRHSIGAAQRKQASLVLMTLLLFSGSAA